jgi:hypothetical protein
LLSTSNSGLGRRPFVARKSGEVSSPERDKRKRRKAQLRLELAQARYLQAEERGRQEIEHARFRTRRWSEKAALRVQRRAVALAKLESALAAGRSPGEAVSHGAAASS